MYNYVLNFERQLFREFVEIKRLPQLWKCHVLINCLSGTSVCRKDIHHCVQRPLIFCTRVESAALCVASHKPGKYFWNFSSQLSHLGLSVEHHLSTRLCLSSDLITLVENVTIFHITCNKTRGFSTMNIFISVLIHEV